MALASPLFGTSLQTSRHRFTNLTNATKTKIRSNFPQTGLKGSFPGWSRSRSLLSQLSSQSSSQLDTQTSGNVKVAFFDVDGTLTKSNIVMPLVIMRMNVGEKHVNRVLKWIWLTFFAFQIPFFLLLDKIDRSLFNRVFYWNYGGFPAESKQMTADVVFNNYFFPNLFSGGVQMIQNLKQDGYCIVLVTGSLDFLVSPLAKYLGADAMLTAKLKEENGRFTGELDDNPVSNEQKRLIILEYAQKNLADLKNCYAFGDSVADLPMLETVGKPCVVNPDSKLHSIAKQRNWDIFYW